MKPKSLVCTCVVLLCWCVQASASRVSGNSSYGNPLSAGAGCSSPYTCDVATDVTTIAADISPEAFQASSYGSSSSPNDFVVFDFQVNNVTAGESLVLTATGAPIAADDGTAQGYGVFSCSPDSLAQCDNDPPPTGYCDGGGCISGNTVTFALFDTHPVFYVVLDDPQVCDGNCTNPPVTVSARIEGSAVPEPRLWPILGLAMLAAFVLRRGRVTL